DARSSTSAIPASLSSENTSRNHADSKKRELSNGLVPPISNLKFRISNALGRRSAEDLPSECEGVIGIEGGDTKTCPFCRRFPQSTPSGGQDIPLNQNRCLTP